jgi:nucleoside-diphosphate-sugar epimerase
VTDFDVVTGAFSYSGAVIARELQAAGRQVRTLTGHPGRAPAGTPLEVRPLDFADPDGLTESLRGARALVNTYWVRFPHGHVSHETAVAQSRVLFRAAAEAGVGRVVHVSITHPSADSPYPYFRGKAAVEQALVDLGLPHTVLRPAILFGGNGVLINNIAWLLRRLPVFAVGGTGEYRIRPVHVDDLARLCVRAAGGTGTEIIDAVGPERPAFAELVRFIKDAVGSRSQVIRVPGTVIPADRPAARPGPARHAAYRRGVRGDGRRPGRHRRPGDRRGLPDRVDHRTQGNPGPHLRQRADPPLPLTFTERAVVARARDLPWLARR